MVPKAFNRDKAVAPFPAESILFRAGSGAGAGKKVALAYVDARMVSERLDEVAPGWSFVLERTTVTPAGKRTRTKYGESETVDTIRVVATGKLIVGASERMDVGETIGDADDGKVVKTAASDALKRCAVHYGIGAYLYSLPKFTVSTDDLEYGWINAQATARLRSEYQAAITGQPVATPVVAAAPVPPAEPMPTPPAAPAPAVEVPSGPEGGDALRDEAARMFPRGWPFGDEKGKDIFSVSDDALRWFVEKSKPGKPEYAERSQKQKDLCSRVLTYRDGEAAALGDALAPALVGGEAYPDDDIPF